MRAGTIDAIRAARMKQTFPTKMTKIERLLRDAMRDAGISFEMHRTMFGRWQPDFVMACHMLIVQADGDYWHRLPKAIANDAAFGAVAKSEGWIVLRFWESRIHADLSGCVSEIIDHLGGMSNKVGDLRTAR